MGIVLVISAEFSAPAERRNLKKTHYATALGKRRH